MPHTNGSTGFPGCGKVETVRHRPQRGPPGQRQDGPRNHDPVFIDVDRPYRLEVENFLRARSNGAPKSAAGSLPRHRIGRATIAGLSRDGNGESGPDSTSQSRRPAPQSPLPQGHCNILIPGTRHAASLSRRFSWPVFSAVRKAAHNVREEGRRTASEV